MSEHPEFRFENHDWDLTLSAAHTLMVLGNAFASRDSGKSQYACRTGGMLLSFCSIESFTNSVAFALGQRCDGFDYVAYRKVRHFWSKIDRVCAHLNIAADRQAEPFRTIEEMRSWRNALVHASPYVLEGTREASLRVPELEREAGHYNYPRQVNAENASAFYKAAYDFVDLIEGRYGELPAASMIDQT